MKFVVPTYVADYNYLIDVNCYKYLVNGNSNLIALFARYCSSPNDFKLECTRFFLSEKLLSENEPQNH